MRFKHALSNLLFLSICVLFGMLCRAMAEPAGPLTVGPSAISLEHYPQYMQMRPDAEVTCYVAYREGEIE